jgi:predicted PurR-regulated permease PerM
MKDHEYGLDLGSKIWSLIGWYEKNVLRRTTGVTCLLLILLGIIILPILAILAYISVIIDTVVEIFKSISNIFSSRRK